MEPTYRVVVHRDAEKGAYVARAPELTGCVGEGATRAEALTRLEEEMNAQFHNIKQSGGEPPRPIDDSEFSGELSLKVTAGLHRELVWQARDEGISLEQLLTEILTHAAAGRNRIAARPSDGDRGPRGERGQGSRYHGIMEDRANFIEYVRGLESGMRGGGGGGGGGRGRNRGRR